MRFCFTEEQEELKKEIREFFQKEMTGDFQEWLEREQEKESEPASPELAEKLAQKGWLGLQQKLGFQENAIFEEEAGYWRAPVAYHRERPIAWVIQHFGTEEQKRAFLPRMASGEMTISFGYSEPNCGSDLASLTTRAVEDGDEYVINGQKLYTTYAHKATHSILAVRTNPDVPKHRGISLVLVDLKSPGVQIRRLDMMGGRVESSEIFYDNVRVPKLNLIGERDRGWYYLAAALDVQRVRIDEVGELQRVMEELVQLVNETENDGKPLSQDPFIRDLIAQRALEVEAARLLTYRAVWATAKGNMPAHYASMATMYVRETAQRLAETGMEILGLYGPLHARSKWALLKGSVERMCRGAQAWTIAGGTSEIQRNVIAQRGLGLPRQ